MESQEYPSTGLYGSQGGYDQQDEGLYYDDGSVYQDGNPADQGVLDSYEYPDHTGKGKGRAPRIVHPGPDPGGFDGEWDGDGGLEPHPGFSGAPLYGDEERDGGGGGDHGDDDDDDDDENEEDDDDGGRSYIAPRQQLEYNGVQSLEPHQAHARVGPGYGQYGGSDLAGPNYSLAGPSSPGGLQGYYGDFHQHNAGGGYLGQQLQQQEEAFDAQTQYLSNHLGEYHASISHHGSPSGGVSYPYRPAAGSNRKPGRHSRGRHGSSLTVPGQGQGLPQFAGHGVVDDDTQYRVELSARFTVGSVFKINWSEPYGQPHHHNHRQKGGGGGGGGGGKAKGRNSRRARSPAAQQDFYTSPRRFIVVSDNIEDGNCTCVPILTYKGRACTKRVNPHYHGIIWSPPRPEDAPHLPPSAFYPPPPFPGEPELGFPPVRVILDCYLDHPGSSSVGGGGLDGGGGGGGGVGGVPSTAAAAESSSLLPLLLRPESRVNYAKLTTVEHNAPVSFLGRVDPRDLDAVLEAVTRCFDVRTSGAGLASHSHSPAPGYDRS